jgi:predicted nucleic acid-binding protein
VTRILVLNASPLILLGRSGYLPLIRELSSAALVPRAVLLELEAGATVDETASLVSASSWITVIEDLDVPEVVRGWDLGEGESQVLASTLSESRREAVLD